MEKILIINDDESICELLNTFLTQKGYFAKVAFDGTAGIQQAELFKPDLILLDVIMPKMDGYQVCEKLKQSKLTQDIPVIFLSSLTESKDKIRGLEVGGVDFVNRVTDRAELLARIQTHLHIRALNKELFERNQELLEKQKHIEEDLIAAAAIQRSLLPQSQTEMNKMNVSWSCIPCEQVGGDIFNVIRFDDEHMIFYILDVSGHGVPSAMITVSVSQQLHQHNSIFGLFNTPNLLSPKEILKSLDKEFPIERFDKFFTIFYMVLNTKTGKICYSNAGHPPGIILHPDREMELLQNGGTVIGINESFPFEEDERYMVRGDKIILYTDGVIEYQNSEEELFGAKRFYDLLEKIKHEPISIIIDKVCSALREFGNGTSPADDVSIMAIAFQEAP